MVFIACMAASEAPIVLMTATVTVSIIWYSSVSYTPIETASAATTTACLASWGNGVVVGSCAEEVTPVGTTIVYRETEDVSTMAS